MTWTGNTMRTDPVSGYLVAGEHYSLTGFRPEDKKRLLELYEQSGNITKSCRAIGISPRTFYHHLKEDQKFHDDFEDAEIALKHEFEEVMVSNGKRPNGFMDRMAWLRARFSEYNPKTTIAHESKPDVGALMAALKETGQVIDVKPEQQT